MAITITKATANILVVIAITLGFISLMVDVSTNYNVQNTTGYVSELQDVTTSSLDSMSNYSSSMQQYIQGAEETSLLGAIVGTIVGAVILPFQLIKIMFAMMAVFFNILGFPSQVSRILGIALTLFIGYAILKLILGRQENI